MIDSFPQFSNFSGVQEARAPPLTSSSDPPPLFNGDTRFSFFFCLFFLMSLIWCSIAHICHNKFLILIFWHLLLGCTSVMFVPTHNVLGSLGTIRLFLSSPPPPPPPLCLILFYSVHESTNLAQLKLIGSIFSFN